MSEPTRQQRSNIDAQEQMVDALWAFAREVEATVRSGESWSRRDGEIGVHMTPAKHRAVRHAMERIAAGYKYRILEVD